MVSSPKRQGLIDAQASQAQGLYPISNPSSLANFLTLGLAGILVFFSVIYILVGNGFSASILYFIESKNVRSFFFATSQIFATVVLL